MFVRIYNVDYEKRLFVLQRVFGPQPPGGGAVRPGRCLHLLRTWQPGLGLRADTLPFQAYFRELCSHVVAGALQLELITFYSPHQ